MNDIEQISISFKNYVTSFESYVKKDFFFFTKHVQFFYCNKQVTINYQIYYN